MSYEFYLILWIWIVRVTGYNIPQSGTYCKILGEMCCPGYKQISTFPLMCEKCCVRPTTPTNPPYKYSYSKYGGPGTAIGIAIAVMLKLFCYCCCRGYYRGKERTDVVSIPSTIEVLQSKGSGQPNLGLEEVGQKTFLQQKQQQLHFQHSGVSIQKQNEGHRSIQTFLR